MAKLAIKLPKLAKLAKKADGDKQNTDTNTGGTQVAGGGSGTGNKSSGNKNDGSGKKGNKSNTELSNIEKPNNTIEDNRDQHILVNHRRGVGKKGKTEFPRNWSDERIIHHVSDIKDNKSIPIKTDPRGTPYKEAIRDGVKIRVTYFPKGHPKEGKVSSAYPPDFPKNP